MVLDVLMATGAGGLGWAGWGTGLDALPNGDRMQVGLCCGTFGNIDREGCAQGKQDCPGYSLLSCTLHLWAHCTRQVPVLY